MDDFIPELVESSCDPIVYTEEVAKLEEPVASINGTASRLTEVDASKRTPITILTGYLGSGKTTMVHSLTRKLSAQGKKIAVILNEFANTASIERTIQIEQSSQVENWVDIGNGCLCCTVKDDGVAAIERLVAQRDDFDMIVLETSGLADPGPIAKMFWQDEAMASNVYIDGVVCVIDGENAMKALQEEVAHVQVAMADVVIINKQDKLANEKDVQAKISSLNALSPVYLCQYGDIDVERVLELHSFDVQTSAQKVLKVNPHGHVHSSGMSSEVLSLPKLKHDADISRFESSLQSLLWDDEAPYEIHRLKGLILGPTKAWVVQGVRQTYELVPLSAYPEGHEEGKLVFIGRDLGVLSTLSTLSTFGLSQ